MEHFYSDWTFKPTTMLHVNASSDIINSIDVWYKIEYFVSPCFRSCFNLEQTKRLQLALVQIHLHIT